MNRDEAYQHTRDMVIAACERRGGKLNSRQIEAVVEVFFSLVVGLASEIQDAFDRLEALECAVADGN